MSCDARDGQSNLYTEFDLVAQVAAKDQARLEELAQLAARDRFIRGTLDPDGDLLFRARTAVH